MIHTKRLLLSLFLAVLSVFACRSFYYSREVAFSFEAKVTQPTEFHVSFSGKNARENEAVRKLAPDTRFQKVDFILPVERLTGVKLSVSSTEGVFELRRLLLSGTRKLSLSDQNVRMGAEGMKDFKQTAETVSGRVGKVGSLTVILPAPLKGRVYFVFSLFFSLFLLSFLLFYKISASVPGFLQKMGTGWSAFPDKKNLVFLIAVFALLLIPSTKIDFHSVVSRENRKLAAPARLTINGRVNNSFGRDFDEWFKDRFAGRDKVIDLYNAFQNTLNRKFERQGVIIGKDNWLFHGRIRNFRGTDGFSEREMEQIRDNLARLQQFCDEHGIKLYIMVTPYKHHVYPELYPDAVKRSRETGRMEEVEAYLKREMPGLNFIYIKHALMKERKTRKEEYLYFKTDHHWTDKGAFTAYRELMKYIVRDFPDVRPVKEEDYDITHGRKVRAECDRSFYDGTQYSLLHLKDESIFNIDFSFYDHKDRKNLDFREPCCPKTFSHYEKGADKKVFYVTDSMGENFMGFLAYTFRDIQKRRYNAEIKAKRKNEDIYMSFYENDILEYKPDILILGTYDGYMPAFKTLYED